MNGRQETMQAAMNPTMTSLPAKRPKPNTAIRTTDSGPRRRQLLLEGFGRELLAAHTPEELDALLLRMREAELAATDPQLAKDCRLARRIAADWQDYLCCWSQVLYATRMERLRSILEALRKIPEFLPRSLMANLYAECRSAQEEPAAGALSGEGFRRNAA